MVSGGVYVPTLYVIRHGEPAVKGVLLGQSDPPLSTAGRLQMQALGLPVMVVYSSPLCRARQSAELLRAPVIVLDDLREIGLGAWDGHTWAEIEVSYPDLARRKAADWTGVTPPGGEQWRHFTRRVDRALDMIRSGAFPAAVVAHVAVNSWLAHRLTGATPLNFHQEYGQADAYEL
jgi:broad specificity phosphatase PhoE